MVDGILIGGSPSTGSSVLVNMLNRHPDVVAGPETYLFIHPKLYTEWPAYRWFLLHRSKWGGLKSIGWFRKNGADLLDPFYGWTQESLSAEIPQALDLPAFAEAFFSKSRKGKDASRWVEKSPSNALCLDLFSTTFRVERSCIPPETLTTRLPPLFPADSPRLRLLRLISSTLPLPLRQQGRRGIFA
ncbi:MAG: sulfotransferase [Saprospirales bacterium]|nr:sulfotransferase [Saprospirales bacterium]